MKLKNIIGSLTAKFAALALALTCAGNVWGANVAKIGNTEYPTLAKAVAAVPADGTATTIVMLSDVELSAYVTIAAKQNVTLDLNGKAITTTTDSSGDHIYAINNKGKMVLKDSVGTGSISARGVYNATTSATMTIESGTYTALDTSGAAIFNKGKLVVNGGTFNGKTCMCNSGSAAKMTVNGATVNGKTVNGVNDYAIKNVSGGTLTINDITVNGAYGAFTQDDGATTINGGTFAFTGVEGSTTYDAYVMGGSLTIAGGSFLKTGNLDLTDEGSCILHVDSPATATVTGGEFASAAGTAAGLFSGAISVKGGSFEIENGTVADVAGYAAAGYAIVNFSGNTSLYRVFMDNWERPDYADLSWYTANPDASTFEISSAAQFAGLAQLVNGKALNADGTPCGTSGGVTFSKKTITLTADIDLSAHGWVPIGYDFYTRDANVDYATKSFYGTLDGGGHTIKLVLSEQNSIYDDDALFGSVRGGTLKNIVLDATISYPGEISAGYWNPNIYGAASGLVTFITGGVVSNVTMNGSVVMGSRGASGAGIVGYAFYGPKFYDCVNNTSVTIKPYYTTQGSSFVIWGGIVSQITGNGSDPVPAALFTRCVNNATVVMGNPYNNDRMLGGSDNGYGSMNRLSSAGETEFYSCRLHAGGIVGQLANAECGYLVQLVDCEDNGSIVGGHAEKFDSEGHYSSLYQKGSFYGKVYEGGSSIPVDYSIDTSDPKNKVFYTYDNTYIFNAEEVDLSSCTHHGEGSYYRPSTSSSGKIVQKVGGSEVEVTDADTIASLNNCARLVGPVIKQTSRVVFQTTPNYVAQIGTTKYESLAAAVAAVPTDGTETTITMLAGETIVADAGITIAAGKNIVLDLNGQTVQMTAASADERWLIKNEGSLTVKDSAENGKLLMSATGQASTAVRKSTIKNMGSLTVESGTIELTYSGTTKEEPTTILNDASDRATSLTVKGGTVVNSANRGTGVYLAVNDTNATVVDVQGGRVEGYGSAVRYYFDDRALTDAKLTFSMSNGTIHGRGMYGIHGMTTSSKDWNGISFDISGGTISCVGLFDRKHVISPLQGAVSISGGTFNGDVYIYGHYLNITDGNFNGAVTLHRVKESLASASISGGQFKGALTIAETTNENTTNPYYNAKFVSGGIYGTAPAARNVVDGNVVVDNTDSNTQGDYPKAIGGAVASVDVDENTTYYATLTDAIAAANEAGVDEITILNGATESPDTGWKVADGKLVRKSYVAQIGTTKYETLAAAIDAAQDGDTVTLLKDVAEPFVLQKNVSVTLNLNGNTISVADGNAISATAGELTVTSVVDDDGYAMGGVVGAVSVSEGASLNLTGGIYDVDWDDCNIEGTIAVSSVNTFYDWDPSEVEAASAVFTSPVPYEYCATGFIPGASDEIYIDDKFYYYVKEGTYLWKITDADGKVAYSEEVPYVEDNEEYWEYDWFGEHEMNRNGFTMTLLHDVPADDDHFSVYVSGLTYTIDLGGHTVNRQMSFGAGKCYVTITNGVVRNAEGTGVSVDNGAQVTFGDGFVVAQSVTGVYVDGGTEDDEYSKLTVTDGAVVNGACGVLVFGSGSENPVTEVVVAGGEINGTLYGISGNGTIEGDEDYSNTRIRISGGMVKGGDVGIYHPQAGELSVSGGAITGGTAIYAKSGTISVTGGELSANGAGGQYDVSYAEDGPQQTGDAFVVDSANYPGGNPTATISGGTFISLNGNGVASYAATGQTTVSNFVSGGYFSQYVTDIYCATGYLCTTRPVKDELYQVVPAATVTYTLAGNDNDPDGAALPSPASFAYPSGDMAEIALTPATCTDGDYTFAGWKVSGEGDAIAVLPAGTTGNITLVATWTGAQKVTITESTKTAEITVTDAWIEQNVTIEPGASDTDKKTAIETALNTKDENGLKKWENYVLGLNGSDPNAKLAADAAQGPVSATPITSNVDVPAVDTGFTVEYKLVSVDTNGTTVTESALQPTPDLTADIAAMTSETNVVYYKTVAVITSTANSSVKVEVESTNTVGVLKVESGAKTTAIAVPWEALGGGDISVSNIVRTANLTPGDELKAYAPDGSGYKAWELDAKKVWQPVTVAGGSSEADADAYKVKRGSAVWLTRADPSQPIYLVGGVAATEKVSVALESKKGDNDPSWNLVGSAGTESVKVSEIAATTDKIVVPTAYIPKEYEYDAKQGGWGYWDYVTETKPSGRKTVNKVWKAAEDIPAGTGFWYLNGGDSKDINL